MKCSPHFTGSCSQEAVSSLYLVVNSLYEKSCVSECIRTISEGLTKYEELQMYKLNFTSVEINVNNN